MGEVSNGVEDSPMDWTPPQLPAIAVTSAAPEPPSAAPDAVVTSAVPEPPSAAPDVDNVTAPNSGNADKTGAAADDEEARPIQGTGTTEADAATNDAVHGTNLSPATPPKTPERDIAPPTTRAGEHATLGAETPPDFDTAKPDGCVTPAHDVEGSDRRSTNGHESPLRGEKPKPAGASLKRDVAAAKSRLLTFRSFSRDKVVNKSGDMAPPLSLVHGKTGEDGAAEHKEKGKERRKRFWK